MEEMSYKTVISQILPYTKFRFLLGIQPNRPDLFDEKQPYDQKIRHKTLLLWFCLEDSVTIRVITTKNATLTTKNAPVDYTNHKKCHD